VVYTGTAYRVRKTDGTFENIPAEHFSEVCYGAEGCQGKQYWKGPDGFIYFIRYQGCDNESTFDKLTIDSSNKAVIAGDGMPLPIDLAYCPLHGYELIHAGGYLYYLAYTFQQWPDSLLKFDYTAHKVTKLSLPAELTFLSQLSVSDDFLYLFGKDNSGNLLSIVKVNVATDTITQILPPAGLKDFVNVGITENFLYLTATNTSSEKVLIKLNLTTDVVTQINTAGYDILYLFVGVDDTVNFTALRLSDGIKVLGEVDKNGAVKILSEGLASSEIKLIQIQ
jgi:hypothetical protein